MSSTGVPGVPLAALDAIQDENTRIVLQAVVDGLNLRNGFTGSGDAAFVTRSELGDKQVALLDRVNNQFQSYTDQIRRNLTPGEINQAINDLQAQVMESALFKALGARVDLIDKPDGIFERLGNTELALEDEITQREDGDTALSKSLEAMGTRVGDAEAAISTEVEQRVNADTALQTTITTQYAAVNDSLALQQTAITTNANNVGALATSLSQLQVSLGDLSAAISEESTARVSADGDLYAQYTLRVDVGGRVSGFGLASDQNRSDFIVRADRFAIASPSTQDGVENTVPFIVQTTTTTLPSGKVLPPGVYIDSAMVKRLDGAYIYAGTLESGEIYTGSTWLDKYSNQPILSQATGQWNTSIDGSVVRTTGRLRFYGGYYHATVPVRQRVRTSWYGGTVTFMVNASATIDHYFSIWYRVNGGTWNCIAEVVEPQDDYGSAGVTGSIELYMGPTDYVDFGAGAINSGGAGWNYGKIAMYNLSLSAFAINV